MLHLYNETVCLWETNLWTSQSIQAVEKPKSPPQIMWIT